MNKFFYLFIFCLCFISQMHFFDVNSNEIDQNLSELSLYIDGKPSNLFPSKDSDYKIESITCNEGANGLWDYESWSLKVSNLSNTKVKCQVSFASIYHEAILNGTDPVLKDNLIPVMISNDGTVKKADILQEWYSYEKQVWANAVILEDESVVYGNNEVIPESNIESYFVWIPRYKYKIFNEGNYPGLTSVENRVQTIEVEFETKDVPVSNGSKVGEWLSHPAFTAFDSNGMWVGKFETGYKSATTVASAQVNSSDSSKIQIKPNVYSWRSIQVANAFTASFNYERDLESHMMKNMEWGAVAFLHQSSFGSRASLRINNNLNFITGYGAVNEPTCGYTGNNETCNKYEGTLLNVDGNETFHYFNPLCNDASTTGNYSGIYDMSGGSWEYVMGILKDQNGAPYSGRNASYHSGYQGILGESGSYTNGLAFPELKYYNSYQYHNSQSSYSNTLLGDATGEMGPFGYKLYGSLNRQLSSWYGDESWATHNIDPWIIRGGAYYSGASSGIFNFSSTAGSAARDVSFRIVLSI